MTLPIVVKLKFSFSFRIFMIEMRMNYNQGHIKTSAGPVLCPRCGPLTNAFCISFKKTNYCDGVNKGHQQFGSAEKVYERSERKILTPTLSLSAGMG